MSDAEQRDSATEGESSAVEGQDGAVAVDAEQRQSTALRPPAQRTARPAAPDETAPRLPARRLDALWLRGSELVLLLVVVAGCAGRIVQWALPRSYSHDEISVLYSLRTLPLGQLLFGHLILDQGSPVLWLAGERGMLWAFGDSERVMRFLPMVFACASVVLVGLLARSVLSTATAVVATGLFAVAPLASFYAWQVKPYSADMAVAAGLLLLAVRLSRSPHWTWRHGLAWWAAAAVGAGLSFSSLLLVGGVSFAMVAGRLVGVRQRSVDAVDAPTWRQRVGECVRFCLPSLVWLGAAAFIYLVQLRHLNGLQGNYAMWLSGYGPTGGSLHAWRMWIYNVHMAILALVWNTPATVWLLIFAIAGAAFLAWRDRAALLVIATPVVVAFVAGAAHLYPLKGRLALWIIPSLVVLIAEPVWPWLRAIRWAWWRSRIFLGVRLAAAAVVLAVIATVALPAARSFAWITAHPERYDFALRAQGHDIQPLLDEIKKRHGAGDRVVAQEAYFNKALWYGHERGVRIDGVLAVVAVRRDCMPDAYAKAAGDARRLWFIGGESWLVTRPAFLDVALAQFRALGHVSTVRTAEGVALYEVDLAAKPDAKDAPATDTPPCARFATWKNPLDKR